MNTNTTMDLAGAASAVLCAVHCAATAFLANVLPVLGLGALLDERLELAFLAAAVLLGAGSMGPGVRLHRDVRPMLCLLSGFTFLLGIRPQLDEGTVAEVAAVVMGATLLACAHLLNLRAVRARHRTG